MGQTLEIRVEFERLPLSRGAADSLGHLSRYDAIVFTSKNAERFFVQELRARGIARPKHILYIRVGPRADLLKLELKSKRILFPRSALAPHDIVKKLRARGVQVRTLTLYTSYGKKLSRTERKKIFSGAIEAFYFKSPSGISGLLRQLRPAEKEIVRMIPAICIGVTTASAARTSGWKKVSIKKVL